MPVPECTNDSNCEGCSGFFDACIAVDGCSYNFLYETCTSTPEFDTDCSSFDGYYEECMEHDNCGFFNRFEGTCRGEAPRF